MYKPYAYFFLHLLLTNPAMAALDKATVILLHGEVFGQGGRTLQVHDEVARGTTVKTGPKSFVKLLFPDNSQMSLGPESAMKLEITPPGSPSLVSLVGGEIRARVTKDLLQEDPAKAKDKLVVKTPKAAMGIRGTDFQVIYNPLNSATSLLTFEGNVAMAKLDPSTTPAAALRQSNVVFVGPGQFSGLTPTVGIVSQPVKISPAQLESMKKNENFQGLDEGRKAKVTATGSPVPPGVNAKNFATVEKSFGGSNASNARSSQQAKGPPPEGVFNPGAGVFAPKAGGFLDIKTGLYVAPPPGSSFDANTGVFVPPKAAGGFDPQSGSYVPPKGLELDPIKGFVAETKTTSATSSTASSVGKAAVATAPVVAGNTTTPVTAPAASASTGNPGAPTEAGIAVAAAPPPPIDAGGALAMALNTSQQASSAGVTVTFDNTITVAANAVTAAAVSAKNGNTPPPPPAALPPPPPVNINSTVPIAPPPAPSALPPPTNEPLPNPFCATCQQQNIPVPNKPANSSVQFKINVQ